MVRAICTFLASLFLSATSFAGGVEQPDIPTGSLWVQRIIDTSGHTVAVFTLALEEKNSNGYDVIRHSLDDGSFARFTLTRNLGQGSPVSSGKRGDGNLYAFPLVDGKTWKSQSFWINELGESGEDDIIYTVMGQEYLDTAAGKYLTVKVVGQGVWTNHITKTSGKLYVVNYYAPEAMMTARSVRTTESSVPGEAGVTNVFELVYFKLGQP